MMILGVLLLMSPAPPGGEDFEARISEAEEQQATEWKTMFRGPVTTPRYYYWLAYLDPRPAGAFRPFTNEYIDKGVLASSWSSTFFQEIASPGRRRHIPYTLKLVPTGLPLFRTNAAGDSVPPGPAFNLVLAPVPSAELKTRRWKDAYDGTGVEGGYFLPTEKGRRSVVQFRWTAKDYAFEMQESDAAILLRIREKTRLKNLKNGVAGSQIESVLQEILSKPILDQGPLRRQFRIPDRVVPGTVFTNEADWRVGYISISGWNSSVLIFVTEKDLCILMFKAFPNRQIPEFPGGEDFSTLILEADGKTPLKPRK